MSLLYRYNLDTKSRKHYLSLPIAERLELHGPFQPKPFYDSMIQQILSYKTLFVNIATILLQQASSSACEWLIHEVGKESGIWVDSGHLPVLKGPTNVHASAWRVDPTGGCCWRQHLVCSCLYGQPCLHVSGTYAQFYCILNEHASR